MFNFVIVKFLDSARRMQISYLGRFKLKHRLKITNQTHQGNHGNKFKYDVL